MEINGGKIKRNDTNQNAMGGSELITLELSKRIDPNLLKEVQIISSRVRSLDESKYRIFLAHDMDNDPESAFLNNGGHNKFHKLVFVSNWQMQNYINRYNIPWSKCVVLHNAIDPIEDHDKPTDVIRLGYWSTPHRGLNLLLPVFDKLCEKHDNIELDVFSSFALYGWKERDKHFEELFNICKSHPKINYHGAVDNDTIRESLKTMHILAYPSIWQETSCIVLMEAMSAGLLCVHPNLGALYETAANWTYMYQFQDDLNHHANVFYSMLDGAIQNINSPEEKLQLNSQKAYANLFYNWKHRIPVWNSMIKSLVDSGAERALPTTKEFVYRTP